MNNMRDLRPREMDMQTETENDHALDLGATVLPVLAKAYWKQAVGVLLVLWVLAVPARSSTIWVTAPTWLRSDHER